LDLSRYDWLWRISRKIERVLSPTADLIISNSWAGSAHAIEDGFPKSRITVIPNGFDTGSFLIDRQAGRETRERLGIPEDMVLVGRVGRLDPMKDYPTFLRAAKILASQRRDLHFICVGHGSSDYLRKLKDLTNELELDSRVVWTSAQGDMTPIYNALDLLCSSSAFGEGFPNVIGEAMACGVPCVVTDVGDTAQIVGNLGVVVPPSNPHLLAQGCLEALKTKPSAEKLRQAILRGSSIEVMVNRTERALLDLLQ
jgi:glycosyltransferase involved in cell wall biosynthesis